MAKAKRLLRENLKLTDIVIEVIDARAPRATRNPDFDSLYAGKARAVILNKSDLADPRSTEAWLRHYRSLGMEAAAVSSLNRNTRKTVLSILDSAARPIVEKAETKGIKKTVRAIVVGIPNVGKSTLINCIVGSKRAAVGDKPGVTKGKQWVAVHKYLELMDTPGILWPKLDDQEAARTLSYLNAIRDEILDTEELSVLLLRKLSAINPDEVLSRFGEIPDAEDHFAVLESVCAHRSLTFTNGEPNTRRAAELILDEFRSGKLGRITLELPEEGV